MRSLSRRPYILYKYTDACICAEEKCIREKRKQSLQAKTKTEEMSIFKGQKDTISLREVGLFR